MGFILFEPRYAFFSFNISNIKNGMYRVYKYESVSKRPFTVYSDTNPAGEIDYLNADSFDIVAKVNVSFDMIEISATDYTKHRLCVTLWRKGTNVLVGDLNFLPIFCFKNILEFIGYELSDKQKSYLNRTLKAYAKKWGFPCYQI